MYTRKELYKIIQNNNLQEEIKKYYGRVYSTISTEELQEYVEKWEYYGENWEDNNKESCFDKSKEALPKKNLDIRIPAFLYLVGTLKNKGIITDKEETNIITLMQE